ncbi:MAG: hypothetical protein K5664_00155 [Firmicutes bacterium]|nr:hypothetical protein [Bacillota bacterium]
MLRLNYISLLLKPKEAKVLGDSISPKPLKTTKGDDCPLMESPAVRRDNRPCIGDF